MKGNNVAVTAIKQQQQLCYEYRDIGSLAAVATQRACDVRKIQILYVTQQSTAGNSVVVTRAYSAQRLMVKEEENIWMAKNNLQQQNKRQKQCHHEHSDARSAATVAVAMQCAAAWESKAGNNQRVQLQASSTVMQGDSIRASRFMALALQQINVRCTGSDGVRKSQNLNANNSLAVCKYSGVMSTARQQFLGKQLLLRSEWWRQHLLII